LGRIPGGAAGGMIYIKRMNGTDFAVAPWRLAPAVQ
jgi:hypothetical protein